MYSTITELAVVTIDRLFADFDTRLRSLYSQLLFNTER